MRTIRCWRCGAAVAFDGRKSIAAHVALRSLCACEGAEPTYTRRKKRAPRARKEKKP